MTGSVLLVGHVSEGVWLGLPAQALGLCTGMVAYTAGYATAGILALLSPLFLPFLPILAPVSPRACI